jgi:hypothetical protein
VQCGNTGSLAPVKCKWNVPSVRDYQEMRLSFEVETATLDFRFVSIRASMAVAGLLRSNRVASDDFLGR